MSRRRKAWRLAGALGWSVVIGGFAALGGRDGKAWAMERAGGRHGR